MMTLIIKKNAIKKFKKSEHVKRIDSMGDAIRFEGIEKISSSDNFDNIYYVYLWS